jgi:hypothetical protein
MLVLFFYQVDSMIMTWHRLVVLMRIVFNCAPRLRA